MKRLLLPVTAVIAVLAVLAAAAIAWADHRASERLAEGVSVAGVDVGGMTRSEALVRLGARIGEPAARAARVRVDGRTFTISATRAGVHVDLAGAVRRAHEASRAASLPSRGWRELTGGRLRHDEPAPVTVDRAALRSFVGSIHAAVARKPVDATLDLALDRVSATPAKEGRRLGGREDLVARLAGALTDPGGERSLRASVVPVPPTVTEEQLWDARPVAVTVSRDGKRARVFRRGELVKTYRVAVGEPKYPTPTGTFSVQSKQIDPIWNVPDSEWAGDLAGKTIPGGDPKNPLIARWIGFNGSVGFHGTKSVDSIGTAASHGCVRMRKADVIDLYRRVEVGTPVLVA